MKVCRLGWSAIGLVGLLAGCTSGSADAGRAGGGGAGGEGGSDAAPANLNALVAAQLRVRYTAPISGVGWRYHVANGTAIITVRPGGEVIVHPYTECEGYQVPYTGQLDAAEQAAFEDLLRRQTDFAEISAQLCPPCNHCGGEVLVVADATGGQRGAGAGPAFRPNGQCEPSDVAYPTQHPAGTLTLTDWLRAHLADNPEFLARLSPSVPEAVRVTVVAPNEWEGRPVPPPVDWTEAPVALATLAATANGYTPSPFVDYQGADRAALWNLCLAGYARWSEVTTAHDVCENFAVFAATEGETQYLVACGAALPALVP